MSMLDRISATNKPKRMRWHTFYRLRDASDRFEEKVWALAEQNLERIKGRITRKY